MRPEPIALAGREPAVEDDEGSVVPREPQGVQERDRAGEVLAVAEREYVASMKAPTGTSTRRRLPSGLGHGRRARRTIVGSVDEEALAAIRAGRAVVLPTDTVYGLVADGYREAPGRSMYRLKRRPESMPCALLAADLDAILDAVPEVRGRAAVAARALLPGPYTLVLPNPARRFRWLCGSAPETVGVRVPVLAAPVRELVARAGVLASTSANLHGGPPPRTVAEVPPELLAAAGAVVDAGELPGTPSTVVDLTGGEPRVLREGAVPAGEAVAAAARALAG